MGLLENLGNGKKREITEAEFEYFLDVLPPAAMGFRWNGERWAFGFAEGRDFVYAFKKECGSYFAQKTDLLNPHECSVSVEDQQQPGFVERLSREKEAIRAASWVPAWLKIGKENPLVREASKPAFTTQSFHACASDDELLDRFAEGNWHLGQAFCRGDLCFIQQRDGGDDWLAIKQDVAFDTIHFGQIIANRGRPAALGILHRMQRACVERCQAREY